MAQQLYVLRLYLVIAHPDHEVGLHLAPLVVVFVQRKNGHLSGKSCFRSTAQVEQTSPS